MNKRSIAMTIVILGALLLGALPAQAASRYEWSDPKGDATYVDVFANVTPSNPKFDITKVAMSSNEGVLTWAASVEALSAGTPRTSTGYFFRLAFTYAGANYEFFVSEDGVRAGFALIRRGWPNGDAEIPCGRCTGVIDRKQHQVIVTAPIASLGAATSIRAGSKLTGLSVLAQRQVGVLTLTSDEAYAPKNVAFEL